MSKNWQLQEAKNKLSQVVDEALKSGPQTITRHGKEVVVVISSAEYNQLIAPKIKLSQFFQNSPLSEIEVNRDRTQLRETDEISD